MIRKTLCLLIAVQFPEIAFAYQFEFLNIKDDVHQRMAEQALLCFTSNPGKHRFSCDGKTFSTAPDVYLGSVNGLNLLTVDDVRRAVVWPDDPVRELSVTKIPRAALWAFRLVVDQCKKYRAGIQDGLRCSSHYGSLQFMHAMEGLKGESAKETQKAILDWSVFAYRVAVNKQDSSGYYNDKDYCEFFAKEPRSKFVNAMSPQDLDGGAQFPCQKKDSSPWQMSTPFALSCTWGSATCAEYTYGNNFIVRKAALGAILHVIQDSYAKGHASRGNDVAINTYECAAIRQFQVYTEQDHERHAQADTYPYPSTACISGEADVDGPVTASAEVIRMFFANEDESKLRAYLADHVFKLADDLKEAGATDFFRKPMLEVLDKRGTQ